MKLQNKSHLLSDRQAKNQCTQLCSVGGKQGGSNIKPLISPSNLTAETELDSLVLLFMLQTMLTLPSSVWQTFWTDSASKGRTIIFTGGILK